MAIGEITILSIAGISLIAVVIGYLMVSRGWNNGSQPLAKIWVRSDNHYRRSLPPEESDSVKIPDWLLGLFAALIIITTTIALMGQR